MVPAATVLVLVALFPALAAVTADDDHRWPAIENRLVLSPCHTCSEEQGSYAPGSAYEANLQLLAATIPAKVNAESCNCSNGNMAGDSPNMVVASAYCPWPWRPGANSSDCGACVSLAFREAQRLCPYHRQAEVVVDGGACTLNFHDYDLMEAYQHNFHDYDHMEEYQHMDMGVAPTKDTLFWLKNVMEFPDILLVLMFQTGLLCVVFLLVLEQRAKSGDPESSDYDYYLPVTGDQ